MKNDFFFSFLNTKHKKKQHHLAIGKVNEESKATRRKENENQQSK